MSARHLRRIPRLEALERRQVLANWGVSIADGVLTIEGTSSNDRIWVCLADELGTVKVQFNTQAPQLFSPTNELDPTQSFTSIVINTYGGNDRVWVGEGVPLSVTVNAGAGNDWVWGGGADDVIHGDHGNDHLYGRGGNDQLFGDAGHDKVWAGAGDDYMEGGDGHDHLHGGTGNDEGWGGNGFDHLFGDEDNDVLHGEAGKDLIYGGLGVDELYGEGDKDHLYGQGDMDWLNGGDGQDKLWGGWGDDWIKGGWGNDHLNGNDGIDTLDGDEGFNMYWNGEVIVTDMPETPPDGWGEPDVPDVPEDPQDPTFVTVLGDSTLGVTFTYSNVGGDHTLEISGHGFLPDGTLVLIFIAGSGLPEIYSDAAGAFHVTFSSVVDAGEQSFGMFDPNTYLFYGADILVSDGVHPDLTGLLNYPQP